MKHILGLLPLMLLIAGQWIWPSSASSAPLPAPAALSSCSASYYVRSGDTLAGIAARCGVSLRALLAANGLGQSSVIRPGQRLVIPGGGSSYGPGTGSVCTNPYTVRLGDTLTSIAARCGVSADSLRRWNKLGWSGVYVGQRLVTRGPAASGWGLPAATAAPPASRSVPRAVVVPSPTPYIEPAIRP